MQKLSSKSKPRGRKGGRRPTKAPAKDKRTAQIRRSQEIFKAKQKARLLELEAKERELEALKIENTNLTIENAVLSSLASFFKTRSLTSTGLNDLTRISYSDKLEEESISGIFNTFNSSESARFELKVAFFRQLFSACGANMCHIPAFVDADQSCNDLDGEEIRDQIFGQESLVISELNALQEFVSNNGVHNRFGNSGGVANSIYSAQSVPSECMPNQFERKTKLKNATGILNLTHLLSAAEIWDILEVISEFSVLNFESLSESLRRDVFCSNFELVMTLDDFVKVLSMHICDRKEF